MARRVSVDELSEWAKQHVGDDDDAVWEFLSRLYLGPPDDEFLGYWCTPLNVDVFSYTDLDGVHFGTFEAIDGESPVVLISPASSNRPCVIVGQSLHDFLCLGCEYGFGDLTALPYEPQEVCEKYSRHHPPHPADTIAGSLRIHFGLTPWENVGQRLFDLQEMYLDELDMPDRDST